MKRYLLNLWQALGGRRGCWMARGAKPISERELLLRFQQAQHHEFFETIIAVLETRAGEAQVRALSPALADAATKYELGGVDELLKTRDFLLDTMEAARKLKESEEPPGEE